MADQAHIRNFSIIAHIDHGKSTLADRILEMTKTVDPRAMRAQVLDSMDLERERGITIKAQAVRVLYDAKDGETYQLHLIDTPGHVDFTYEVSRSLAACEGALLVVDASQGVEAQTLANTYLAIEGGLELIPVLNKIDLPGAEPERVAEEVADLLGEPMDDILHISGKTGEGVIDVLEQLVAQVPPPSGDPDAPPRALIFDSEFDQYRGVIAYIRVVDGVFKKGDAIKAMVGTTQAEIDDIGFFTPAMVVTEQLSAGEVGFLITGIKEVSALAVGDTLTTKLERPADRSPCRATATSSPSSSAACFRSTPTSTPTCATRWRSSRSTTRRCPGSPRCPRRSASAFAAASSACCTWTSCASAWSASTTSSSWRRCRRCASTSRSPTSREMEVHIPSDFPDPGRIKEIREPMIEASILTPKEYIGPIMELCIERRGTHKGMHYLTADRVQLTYDLPLAEIVIDFFDALKSRTRGYASLDYELGPMVVSDMVKLDILLGGEQVDALSMVVHRDKAYDVGPQHRREAQEEDPAPAVRRADPGRDRRGDHRARDGQGLPQGRHRRLLRRRHLAQAQAAGEAEGRQEAHEAGRPHRGAAGGLPRGARARRLTPAGAAPAATRAAGRAPRGRRSVRPVVGRRLEADHRLALGHLDGTTLRVGRIDAARRVLVGLLGGQRLHHS